jgi:hypothetical protein
MIKFLLQASIAMLFTLASLISTSLIAQDCITFEFPNETGEATFLSDGDMCGTNVTWEEPVIMDECGGIDYTVVTNFEQGQYFDVGYYELVYQAFDEDEVLLGQSEFYLDVFDDTAPVPQGENITQDDPIDFPQYYDGPDVLLTGEFNVDDLPNYTGLDNCAGEVDGVVESIELDDNTTLVTYIFFDGTQASELEVLVYSNVLNCVVFVFPNETGEETFNSDADMCGTNVTWEEPAVTNSCGDGEVTIVTNFDQGQYFEVGYHQLVYQAFDEDGILVGQSEFYLDVFDNLAPVPQGEDITQENPIDFPQYFDGPDVNLEGDYDVALLPNYIALDNCAGEVVGVPEVVVLDADTRIVTYIFSDGTQSSELDILVYSNVVIDSVGESVLSDAQGNIGMSIFPNPIADKATVKLDSQFSNSYEVTVYSMTGKVVYTDVFVNGENQLDAEFLASGMYTIHVTSGASSKIERFIKK